MKWFSSFLYWVNSSKSLLLKKCLVYWMKQRNTKLYAACRSLTTRILYTKMNNSSYLIHVNEEHKEENLWEFPVRGRSEYGEAVKKSSERASLVEQWLRIHLPMQGTRVRALVGKIPRAAEQLSPCATTTEPALYSPWGTTTEARVPRARALQQEKPQQWEAHAPQWRVAPARGN